MNDERGAIDLKLICRESVEGEKEMNLTLSPLMTNGQAYLKI